MYDYEIDLSLRIMIFLWTGPMRVFNEKLQNSFNHFNIIEIFA